MEWIAEAKAKGPLRTVPERRVREHGFAVLKGASMTARGFQRLERQESFTGLKRYGHSIFVSRVFGSGTARSTVEPLVQSERFDLQASRSGLRSSAKRAGGFGPDAPCFPACRGHGFPFCQRSRLHSPMRRRVSGFRRKSGSRPFSREKAQVQARCDQSSYVRSLSCRRLHELCGKYFED